MTPITVYGIENCDQVRKARRWLNAHGLPVQFHDFRTQGLNRELLLRWMTRMPWDALINRRGLTWRGLEPGRRAAIVDQASAIEALLAAPTLVKRPVVEVGERLLIGFSEPVFQSTFLPETP
jgi:arsenate reductase